MITLMCICGEEMDISYIVSEKKLREMMEWIVEHASNHGILRKSSLIRDTFTLKTRKDGTPVPFDDTEIARDTIYGNIMRVIDEDDPRKNL